MSMFRRLPAGELELFNQVSTATIATQLQHRGIRRCVMLGLRPCHPGLRMAGYAYTLRYVPAREDIGMTAVFDNDTNQQRLAIEELGPDDVLVIDARGDASAGSLGNILATRAHRRGAAGIVTDGAFRDTPEIERMLLPCYASGANARLSSAVHHPADRNVPIGCGGVLVMPGDVVVGDGEGVIVIPNAIAADVAKAAVEQEGLEKYILERVDGGSSIRDVYPPSTEFLAEYEAARRSG